MNVGIVGGGIFGIAAAIELRERGHEVTVFDQGAVPNRNASSTDLSKAIRRLYGTQEIYIELVERAAIQWAKWQSALGGSFYFPVGQLQIIRDFQKGSSLYEGVQLLSRRGASLEVLTASQCRERFPQFTYEVGDTGIWDSWAGYLASGEAVEALAGLARSKRVLIRENVPVMTVVESGTGVELGLASGAKRFDRVVVAAGVWLKRFFPRIGDRVLVTRQQMAFFQPVDPFVAASFPTWVVNGEEEGWYGAPILRHGWVKVSNDLRGDVVDPDANHDATPEFLDQARDFVARRIPGLASDRLVSSRSCFYANTPDLNFIVDWAPGQSRILIAGGGSGHGFKFGGSIGPVIADALEEKSNPLGDLFRIGHRFD
jgi:glycine/D-amino acid oxidase-like deaminating enzyme